MDERVCEKFLSQIGARHHLLPSSNRHLPSTTELPCGSTRKQKSDYVEILVPALEPQFDDGEESAAAVLISSMPDWARPVFADVESLNQVQSRVYQRALFSQENLLVCAPFLPGETTQVALLPILQQVKDVKGNYFIAYAVPTKSMVARVVAYLSDKLESTGLKVKAMINKAEDGNLRMEEIEDAPHILVTTPEEWDLQTRTGAYTERIKLLIIDGLHLIHDKERGPILESCIARILGQIASTGNTIRLVGFSGTFSNYEDLAMFLRVDIDKGLFYFDNRCRRFPLSQKIIGFQITPKRPYAYDLCYNQVKAALGKGQVLIFVNSIHQTEKTSSNIVETLTSEIAKETCSTIVEDGSATHQILCGSLTSIKSANLKCLLPHGFAIHHLGLDCADRKQVEDLFRLGHVKVLICTATFAWGVNLLADTVIINGTRNFYPEQGAKTELSPLDAMQMFGHAKRQGVIITGSVEVYYYLCMMNERFNIESRFASKLPDHLITEIALLNVQNASEACDWLGYTFLYLRLLRNPITYLCDPTSYLRDPVLYMPTACHWERLILKRDFQSKEMRAYLIHAALTILHNDKLQWIKYDSKMREFSVLHRNLLSWCRLCSHYSISRGSVSTYANSLQPTMGDAELYRLVLHSEEFEHIAVGLRVLPELETLNKDLGHSKINTMLLRFEELSDTVYIYQSWRRHLRALFEINLTVGRMANLAHVALNLCKMDTQQFPELSSVLGTKLFSHTESKVFLNIIPLFEWVDKVHGYAEPFWVLVENDMDHIVHYEYFLVKKQHIRTQRIMEFTVPTPTQDPLQYNICIVSDRWREPSLLEYTCHFDYSKLPNEYPPQTRLLKSAPLPVTALIGPFYRYLYQGKIEHLNRVQTEVFEVLQKSDVNVLVAAPEGSGKTICAELAILNNHRNISTRSRMCVVYIAPFESLAEERYRDWESRFNIKGMRPKVVQLTGETARDLKLLNILHPHGLIIISTPEKWDALSCHKVNEEVTLFIVDGLHLICRPGGHILELIVSRMISIQHIPGNKRMRIVALSTTLADGEALGQWIDAPSEAIFNFPLSVRPVPLELLIQEVPKFEVTMQEMMKLTRSAISQHAKNGRPSIVFVPSSRHLQPVALDLMKYLNAGSGKEHLLLPYIAGLSDEVLKRTLCNGVGYLHEGSTRLEKKIVSELFEGGEIQVCVMSSSICWGKLFSAYLVVVMGTQYDDVPESMSQYADFPVHLPTDYHVTDLKAMIGHAGRPQVDDVGICFILCHAHGKAQYMPSLSEALAVESTLHIENNLNDFLNAGVVSGRIPYTTSLYNHVTRTFLYERAHHNPWYYFSIERNYIPTRYECLWPLVKAAVTALEHRKFISVDDDDYGGLSPLSLGKAACDNYISFSSIEYFRSCLSPEREIEVRKIKVRGLLDILKGASEYSKVAIRPGEEEVVRRLIARQKFFKDPEGIDPGIKALALLQAHFSRQHVDRNLALDQQKVLLLSSRLLHVIIDVISSYGYLELALRAMSVCQMVTQGMWNQDSYLLQLPHFTKEVAEKFDIDLSDAFNFNVFVEMDAVERRKQLKFADLWRMDDIAAVCNHFPNICMTHKVLTFFGDIVVQVHLERHLPKALPKTELKGMTLGHVYAPRYPDAKEEAWWLVIGDIKEDSLLAMKKFSLQDSSDVELKFAAPASGKKSYQLYMISDSYMGFDQEEQVSL